MRAVGFNAGTASVFGVASPKGHPCSALRRRIGTEIGARAVPDGYTLLIVSTSTLATNVGLYSKLPFDPVRDFAPITLIVTAPNVLVVNPAVAAASVQELIQLAKAHPQRLNFSSFGSGSSAHLIGEMFKRMAGIDIVHVPYKGGVVNRV